MASEDFDGPGWVNGCNTAARYRFVVKIEDTEDHHDSYAKAHLLDTIAEGDQWCARPIRSTKDYGRGPNVYIAMLDYLHREALASIEPTSP